MLYTKKAKPDAIASSTSLDTVWRDRSGWFSYGDLAQAKGVLDRMAKL